MSTPKSLPTYPFPLISSISAVACIMLTAFDVSLRKLSWSSLRALGCRTMAKGPSAPRLESATCKSDIASKNKSTDITSEELPTVVEKLSAASHCIAANRVSYECAISAANTKGFKSPEPKPDIEARSEILRIRYWRATCTSAYSASISV